MKSINDFFKPLSREEKEVKELKVRQECRKKNEIIAKVAELTTKTSAEVIEIINLADENEVEGLVETGDVVRGAFQEMMNNVTVTIPPIEVQSTGIQLTDTKRAKMRKRPSNWQEIALYYMTFKKVRRST